MEEMQMDMARPGPGLYGSDRELFQRVWSRVVPEGTQSPIRMEAPPVAQPQQSLVPMVPREEPPVDCLGDGAQSDVPRLEELARQAVHDGRVYQALVRRAGGAAARVLAGMAADQRRHAKKLAAAYFLITGQRWQGPTPEVERAGQELMLVLREQYMAEQRGAAVAQAAAQETDDRCLGQLFDELAREKQDHARVIRALLEQM